MNSKTALTKEVNSTSATAPLTEEERQERPDHRSTTTTTGQGGHTTQEGENKETHDSFSHTKTKGLYKKSIKSSPLIEKL